MTSITSDREVFVMFGYLSYFLAYKKEQKTASYCLSTGYKIA